jgi:hypothetical protein
MNPAASVGGLVNLQAQAQWFVPSWEGPVHHSIASVARMSEANPGSASRVGMFAPDFATLHPGYNSVHDSFTIRRPL